MAVARHDTGHYLEAARAMATRVAAASEQIDRDHAEFYEPHYFKLFDGLPRQKDGYVDLPTGPGLGLTFNEEVADAHPYVPVHVNVGRGI